MVLPHGTGTNTRVAVFAEDEAADLGRSAGEHCSSDWTWCICLCSPSLFNTPLWHMQWPLTCNLQVTHRPG